MHPVASTDRWTLHDPSPARAAAVHARLAAWDEAQVARRLWAKDPTLWAPEDEAVQSAIRDRLGWLELPRTSAAPQRLAELQALADAARAQGVRRVLLMGMGGSSLAPEVFQRVLGSADGSAEGAPTLSVLDSTHPAAVRAALEAHPPAESWFISASKSGTTLETLSFLRAAWAHVAAVDPEPGMRFVAITDPGSKLAQLGAERGFRAVLLARPDVGGRYSALSAFGLAPAALIGADVAGLLARARQMAADCGPHVPALRDPSLLLGASLGELARAGRNTLVLLTSPGLAAFPDWMEQLIAESLGKDGVGIVPVAGELPRPATEYGPNRVFCQMILAGGDPPLSQEAATRLVSAGHPVMRIVLRDRLDIAGEMMRWELAVATAGIVMGVQPFDQPNVELAKQLARKAMAGSDTGSGSGDGAGESGGGEARSGGSANNVSDNGGASAVGSREIVVDVAGADSAAGQIAAWLDASADTDVVALMAFLATTSGVVRAAGSLRRAVTRRGRYATTFGWGPRFLHSTGQLHKGGPDSIRALQIVDTPAEDMAVPEADFRFGRLLAAQADGDRAALEQEGRDVLRVRLEGDAAEVLDALATALVETSSTAASGAPLSG